MSFKSCDGIDMAANLNYTGNILDFFTVIGQYWTRKKGLILTLIVEFIVILSFWDRINLGSISAGLLKYAGLAVITIIIWLITSKRILFRSVIFVVFWLVLSLAVVAWFYLRVYPQFIEGTYMDLPYIQIWSSLLGFIVIILLGVVIDCCVFKGKRLLIVFAVNNESIAVEKTIRSSIDPVVQNIQDADFNVKLYVLPFGILKSVRRSEKYIKCPLTRADAVIFASVVDDSDSSPAGYVFTKFSSRINERRFAEEERRASIHNVVLDAQSRCKDWNFLNAANDNCSRKIIISNYLEEMLRMYIGCIYLMKHDFKAALPYTNNAIYREHKNSITYNIASSLYSYSVLSAARELENEDHDYDAALIQLNNLVRTLPVNNYDPGYNKAMARVMYYKGDIKTSEEYTRRFKDLPQHRWGYELNMGFYAINKKKVLEFVQHYKNLRKYSPCEQKELDFAIQFLEYQVKESKDSEYTLLLQIAIAYLHIYLNPRKAKRLMEKVKYKSSNVKSVKAIDDLREIVSTTTKRWDITPLKKLKS